MSNLVRAMLAMAFGLGGCGAGQGNRPGPVNTLAVEREATDWTVAWHGSVARGDLASHAAAFAPAALWVGPAPDEVRVGPAAVAESMGAHRLAGAQLGGDATTEVATAS